MVAETSSGCRLAGAALGKRGKNNITIIFVNSLLNEHGRHLFHSGMMFDKNR